MTPGKQGLRFHMLVQLGRLLQVTASPQPLVRATTATLELKMMIHIIIADLTVHIYTLIKKGVIGSALPNGELICYMTKFKDKNSHFQDYIDIFISSVEVNFTMI